MDKRIGAQLYTCRDFCQTEAELDKTLARISEIGYKTAQFSGIGGDITGSFINKSCKTHGITPICTHKGFEQYRDDIAGMIKFHLDLGCSIAGMGCMPHYSRESKDELYKFIDCINKISQNLNAHGLTFAYHNHAFEFKKIEGKYILDHLVENTDENIKLIFDTYWVAHAGLNVVSAMEKYGHRIAVMHYKDKRVADSNNTEICEVGEGNLDWDGIISATERLDIPYTMVEQDDTWWNNDPFKSLDISYKFLTKKGFI